MPNPMPSKTPAAMAKMFLSAPPTSTPTTSVLAYTRMYWHANSRAASRAVSRSARVTHALIFDGAAPAEAMTRPVGCISMSSLAKDGPDTKAMDGVRPSAAGIRSFIISSVSACRPCTC